MEHRTVLRDAAVEALALRPDAHSIDCTLGSGGHSLRMLDGLGPTGRLLALDADPAAIAAAPEKLKTDPRVRLCCANFKHLQEVADEADFSPVSGILADLGWRSEQFGGGGKGFSFQIDEPLLMTFGDPADYLFTARDVVNDWEESSIADIIYGYGEERAARKIAAAIVKARKTTPIETSVQLAAIIAAAIGNAPRNRRLHPATKSFQALRMAVNDELGALQALLQQGFELLTPGGRLAIISFHSLEDRVVKQAFRSLAHDQLGTLVGKKPIIPSTEEVRANPRARSAKLRTIEKR